MAKKLDERLLEILLKYGEKPETALWDCHGTWVAYHAAVERIAARAGIVFDMPQVIEANAASKVVAIAVRGTMGDRSEWSFGEAAPSNNKNGYPYAMAEKRAKDRVTLKLTGLHGAVYSEEEADDFKSDHSAPGQPAKSSAALKRDGAWEAIEADLENDFADCHSLVALSKLREHYRERARKEGFTKAWMAALKDRFEAQEQSIRKVEELAA